MNRIQLTPRLRAVANFVPTGSAVADIGTDHGYIPVWLVQSGTARCVVATDIKPGPLSRARASAALYGVDTDIEFIQTDGLVGMESAALDTVILAGMGGETMLGILDSAPWAVTRLKRLILQPQSKSDVLVKGLADAGFSLCDAKLVKDDGRIYVVLAAEPGTDGHTALPLLMNRRDPLLPAYLDSLIAKKRRVVAGLNRAYGGASELGRQTAAYEELTRLKEETQKWPK